MKKLSILIFFVVFLVGIVGCASTKPVQEQIPTVEPDPQEPKEPVVEPEPEPTTEPEPEPEPEPTPEPVKELTPEEQEFLRSTVALNGDDDVTIDTFTKDKQDILDTIDKLAVVMKTGNYNGWLGYVSPESQEYWSNPKHLKEVESKLPVKGLKIAGLRDYFKYIFVPARSGHQVDEIRYISGTLVKAVQVQQDRDIVFYTFEKVNDKWLLKLDTL